MVAQPGSSFQSSLLHFFHNHQRHLFLPLCTLPIYYSWRNKDALGISIALSSAACWLTHLLIPQCAEWLRVVEHVGRDLGKKNKEKLPESLGVVAGTVYLMAMFVFVPVPFLRWFGNAHGATISFPAASTMAFQKLGEYTGALLSICAMLFLGFADDVINLKWRYKLILPALATLPLLVIYNLTSGETSVVVPFPLRPVLGALVDLHGLYYLYMIMVAIFCTNSINILAGINGLEVGQSIVIACSILLHNFLEIASPSTTSQTVEYNQLSVFLLLPFVGVSGALLKHNWFPASVFVGDTYCYFAGMMIAVAAILGHFSKTLMLLMLPQLANFVYSAAQIFGVLPCPRHRLPRLNEETGLLEPSVFVLEHKQLTRRLSWFVVAILMRLRLAKVTKVQKINRTSSYVNLAEAGSELESPLYEINNLTLLNLLLIKFGPMRENLLSGTLLLVQALSAAFGLLIRHQISRLLFP